MSDNKSAMKSDAQHEAALFQAASQLTDSARASFLDNACRGDVTLRARLEALLAAHEQPDGALADAPAVRAATIKIEMPDESDAAIGQRIGRYKILEKVGEGGCGVVYVAEQSEPVRRRVALKVIKLGMDTKQVVARFEAERQALAMMDHPNIAKVLDAGSTESGRPYFIMELVRGIRITDYCDQNKLSTNDRLDLFIKICQAIQHAHQKGIIHRDIKPSNILVTLHDGVPVPKVIDFGIAKATEGRLTDATVYTQLHQFIGTPAYMSPEQAEMSGLDIDTRSDIYSLGVLLYELLTGRTPFDAQELMSQGIDAMRKTIREKDPVRPSTKLATLQGDELTTTAQRRSVDSSRLANLLRGDLDWIVMKCLEKDRTRRYETANGLAFDLKRHLNNETVVARPPSSAYRFQKMIRRNKVAVAAAATVIGALVLGIIATTWQALRATRAKQEALAAQARESVQRQTAEVNEQKAVAAQKVAAEQELIARQRAYASDMNVTKAALDANNLGRALDMLNRQRPQPGQTDLRGWEWRYLWGQTRSDSLFTLCQESSEIYSLSVSPDGNLLAIGTHLGGGVDVWDLRTRQKLIRLEEGANCTQVAFSPTEPLLAMTSESYSPLLAMTSEGSSTAGERQTKLRLWNITTRQVVAEVPLDHPNCASLEFASDGRTLMTETERGEVTIWRVPGAEKLTSHPVESVYQSAESTFAVTKDLSLAAEAIGQRSGRVRIFNLGDGKERLNIEVTKDWVGALTFSPDGKTLACADRLGDFSISLWDVATGKLIGRMKGHSAWVTRLLFSPDGKKLFSASTDQTIRVWDVAQQQCLDTLRGHRLEVWRLALLPDGKTLVSGAKDGTVCFWDTSVTHPRQARINIPVDGVNGWSFSPDGQSVLTFDHQGRVMQWAGADFQKGTTLLELRTNIFSGQLSAKGDFLAASWTDGVVQVWNLQQRELVHEWTNSDGLFVADAVFAGGKKLILWNRKDNSLREFDVATGRKMQSWDSAFTYEAGIFSSDERLYFALGYLGDFVFKNLADGSERRAKLDAMEISSAGFSPNAKQFAAGSYLGYARVWDTSTLKPVATLGGLLNSAKSVNYTPDSKRLVVASNENEAVKLYDTESWQDVLTLESVGSGVNGAAFSPDGNSIAWGNTSTLYLWRAPSWDEIAATEAKDAPSPGYGATGKAESRQP
jgi:WD40 repeat protein/serine/threonine protein kinase